MSPLPHSPGQLAATVPREKTWEFDAIGTRWRVDTVDEMPDDARAAVDRVIEAFDSTWSRFRTDSLVSLLARGAGPVPVPTDAAAMLDVFEEVSLATSGAVNPLVGASLDRLGYDASYSFRAGDPLAAPTNWPARVRWRDERLVLDEPAMIDVGALGKGRLVDVVARTLEPWTEGRAVVDASGDLLVTGVMQRIGLEHPFDAKRAIGVWEVRDAALCASAANRRAWGDGLHHVLDARTGVPVRTVAATWVVAETAMRADALATALFFDGGDELAHRWGAEWVRMLTNGRVEWSHGCSAELFTRTASVA
ncbi:FAD:protein FMN transferase [Microbacterium sp.]|uniref:FAD:protein FMN transferase n=1 Tax=Microbacterium sp. TaxID=51671 RepID=UPI0037C771F9